MNITAEQDIHTLGARAPYNEVSSTISEAEQKAWVAQNTAITKVNKETNTSDFPTNFFDKIKDRQVNLHNNLGAFLSEAYKTYGEDFLHIEIKRILAIRENNLFGIEGAKDSYLYDIVALIFDYLESAEKSS